VDVTDLLEKLGRLSPDVRQVSARAAALEFLDRSAQSVERPCHTRDVRRDRSQLLRPGVRPQAHRQTSSAVYHVFAGQGSSVIDGQRFHWRQGDFFAVPPWAWHEHANEGSQEAILFSIQDTPVFEALGLYREEAYEENGGHQLVTGVFEG